MSDSVDNLTIKLTEAIGKPMECLAEGIMMNTSIIKPHCSQLEYANKRILELETMVQEDAGSVSCFLKLKPVHT